MQVIKIIEFLLQELRKITNQNNSGNRAYREGYLQAIKDFMTAYEDNN